LHYGIERGVTAWGVVSSLGWYPYRVFVTFVGIDKALDCFNSLGVDFKEGLNHYFVDLHSQLGALVLAQYGLQL
jgi:hypothetical protein